MYYHHHKTSNPSQSMFHRHIHSDYEMLYFERGDAEFIVEGSVCRLKRGDLLLIRPRTYHYLHLRSESAYERYVINFTEEEIGECEICIEPDREYVIYSISENSVVSGFFKTWGEYDEMFTAEDRERYVNGGLRTVLSVLKYCKGQNGDELDRSKDTLKGILRFIDANIEEPINAEILANEFYVSSSWLAHVFRSHLGISLMRYINQKKMLYAQQLIWQGAPPTEVAVRCHFENYATFYRQYKKILGRSPKEDKGNIATHKINTIGMKDGYLED